ncbi:MAG: hypothetical protein AAF628_30840 [Planctomycetota bacterium]
MQYPFLVSLLGAGLLSAPLLAQQPHAASLSNQDTGTAAVAPRTPDVDAPAATAGGDHVNREGTAAPRRAVQISTEAVERSARNIRYRLGKRSTVSGDAPVGRSGGNANDGVTPHRAPTGRDRTPTRALGSGLVRHGSGGGENSTGGAGAGPMFADRAVASVLVYDDSSINNFAQTAAFNIEPGTVVANAADFNTQLTSQSWDLVVVDCPNTIPSGGWTDLQNYVNADGKAILSYWNWDVDPTLSAAFDVSVSATISWTGATLFDSGSSGCFAGVTMPNSDWGTNWADDGDEFIPNAGAVGLGHIGDPSTPVMVLGNGGNTIASSVIDEAGNTWINDGSAVRLWENMIRKLLAPKNILVYDNNSNNSLAAQAAMNLDPFGTVVGDASSFNGLLTSGTAWDAVLVDCPGLIPTGGWADLEAFVAGGGRVALSFWDWDNVASYPTLATTFDVLAATTAGFTLTGTTLEDSDSSRLFRGVTMPNSDWGNAWSDDGDEFVTRRGGIGLAHVGTTSRPVMVLGNCGRTIASFVIDEAGATWLGDGSAVRLWENMLKDLCGIKEILVYDNNSINNLAQQAAMNLSSFVTVADSTDYNGLLPTRNWDVVLVDCPGTIPSGGWIPTVNYIRGGGRAAMSFWDWDNDAGQGDPALFSAFEMALSGTFGLTGQTLIGTSAGDVFDGVTMPNSDWNDNWGDDGDEFVPLTPGLAHLGTISTPNMVLGNCGRTIASFVIDEAGATWLGDGSAVRLWENMIREVCEVIDILVYDDGSVNALAAQAAMATDSMGTVVADTNTFNALLSSETWDVVAIDCPSTTPSGGWNPTINYVRRGGRAVMSFWDWDNDSGQGDPNLPPAFEVQVATSISLNGQTLVDSGTQFSRCLFRGVSMPNSDWNDNWTDDGDEFGTLGSAMGLADIGGRPVKVLGNQGRTIATFAVDEAGATWLKDGSGTQLWKNMLELVLQCTACRQVGHFEVPRLGVPANPNALRSGGSIGAPPVINSVWTPFIDHSAFLPAAVIDALIVSANGVNQPIAPFGTLLGSLGLPLVPAPPGTRFPLNIPNSCAFVGACLTIQGASADAVDVRLTNALDVKIGTF